MIHLFTGRIQAPNHGQRGLCRLLDLLKLCPGPTVLLLAGLLVRSTTFGAAPTLDQIFPLALPSGSTNKVTLAGKFDTWPVKFWCDAPSIRFIASTNRSEVQVEIPADVVPGPRAVRVFDEQGSSAPRLLLVTSAILEAEKEANDQFKDPQQITNFPARIQGRLEKSGDVDCFGVRLEKGQTLITSLQAYTLGSPVDAVLRLVDQRGIQLAVNHDDGKTFDPFLSWTAHESGTYVVQVFGFPYPADSDVRFTGNPRCVYLLSISTGPWIRQIHPLGHSLQKQTRYSLESYNSKAAPSSAWVPSETVITHQKCVLRFEGHENSLQIPVTAGPEWTEAELLASNQPLTAPSAVTGHVTKRGEEDRYRFKAVKGELLILEVQSAAFGFPMDLWLKITDSAGKEITRNDDARMEDPKIEWAAPADGEFFCIVGDTLNRGSEIHPYRLSIERAVPSIRFVASEPAIRVEPGQTNNFKITVTRSHGHTNEFLLSVPELPTGVSVEPVKAPEKSGDVELKFQVSTNAIPTNMVFRLIASSKQTGETNVVLHELTSSGINNGVPNGFHTLLLDSVKDLWLTILPKPTNAVAQSNPAK